MVGNGANDQYSSVLSTLDYVTFGICSSNSPFDPTPTILSPGPSLSCQVREFMSSQFSLPVETGYPRAVLNAP